LKGQITISIRQFKENENGILCPHYPGISMSLNAWRDLNMKLNHLEYFRSTQKETNVLIGTNELIVKVVKIGSGCCIDIQRVQKKLFPRQNFVPGITLKNTEFQVLLSARNAIDNFTTLMTERTIVDGVTIVKIVPIYAENELLNQYFVLETGKSFCSKETDPVRAYKLSYKHKCETNEE
jgi:hypothetical protein